MKNKIKLNDIFAYMLGIYRLWAYSNYIFLLRKHIVEQYEYRLSKMNPECYSSGSCVKCGCDTPALQIANKACDGGCYFKMFSKKKWKSFKQSVKDRETIINNWQEEGKEEEDEYVWPIMNKRSPHYIVGFDPATSDKPSVGINPTTFKISIDKTNRSNELL